MWENPKGLYTCRTSLGTFCLHPSPLQILDNCPALPGHVKWEASTAAASVLRPSLIETSVLTLLTIRSWFRDGHMNQVFLI